MADDERCRIVEDGGLEDFSGMDDARVDASDVCPMDGDDPVLRIEQDDEEYLTVNVLDETFGDTERVLGGRNVRRLERNFWISDLLADTSDFNECSQLHGKAPFASGMQSDTVPSC